MRASPEKAAQRFGYETQKLHGRHVKGMPVIFHIYVMCTLTLRLRCYLIYSFRFWRRQRLHTRLGCAKDRWTLFNRTLSLLLTCILSLT